MLWQVNSLQEEKCAQKEIKDYNELSCGVFLTKVWLQIDPQPAFQCVVTSGEDTAGRIRRLSCLLNNIKAFYDNILDQTLVLKLPDIIKIANNATDDTSTYDEMRVLLLLVLGCAVQCDRKKVFIDGIKQLDISVQHSIVECIQQITDNPESVWLNTEWGLLPDEEQERQRLYALLVQHVNRLAKEREELFNRVIDLSLELDSISAEDSNEISNSLFISSPHISHSVGEQKSHILVELADVKSKLRRVQHELEEKNEIVSELKELLEQNKESCNKLRHENLELIQEARSAKAFRDEIDVLNERVRKVDRLENEVQRYRDRMNELEFYKSRVEELREDNRILSETKTMLEEQLDTSRKRGDQLPELEAKILKLSAYANELNIQKDLDRNQIESLVEEIAHLRLDKKSSAEELSKVQSEMSHLKCQMKMDLLQQNGEGNLLEQINNDASKRLLKLELENQRLQSLVENIKNSRSSDMSTALLDNNNEDIYHRLNGDDIPNGNFTDDMLSPNDVSMTSDSVSLSMSTEFSAKLEQIETENQVLRSTVERVKNAESKIGLLERLRNDLQNELRDMKSKQSQDCAKYEQIEKNCSHLVNENQRLQRLLDTKSKRYEEVQQEIQALESENQKLVSTADTLRTSLRRLNDLEREVTNLEADNHRLEQEKKSSEKEVARLKAAIETKDTTIDEYASKLSTIELENRQMKREIDHHVQTNSKLKELEKENKELSNELFVCKETIRTLRQDLVSEKIKDQQTNCQLEKVINAIEAVFKQKITGNDGFDDDHWSQILEEGVDQMVKKSTELKELKITALEEKLRELSETNARLNTSIEALKAKSEPFIDSDLISELQVKLSALEDENKNSKNENMSLKEAIDELSDKCKSLESTVSSLTAKNSELNSDRAKLQVENSLIKSQNSSLVSQNENLEAQISLIQEVRDRMQDKHQELENQFKVLAKDHEALQTLHQQLTADYESQSSNTSTLKSLYKKLKSEHKSVQEKLEVWLAAQQEVRQTNDKTEAEQSKRSEEIQLNERVNKLQEENKSLNEEHKRLQTEYKMLQNIYKKLRSENNDLKLKHTELQGETAECRDRMALLDVEVSKLVNYCEMVALTNNSIESQRKRLINNISNLLSQYHDLLTQIGGESEKVISDQMHDLSAKKERLEKMIKDYDTTLERKKVAVTNQNVVRRIHKSSTDVCVSRNANQRDRSKDRNSAPIDTLVDEAIYGRIWEAETPPIGPNTAILRPFRSTSASSLTTEQNNSKSSDAIKQINNESAKQIKEEITGAENNCVISPVPPPRPPPRVSTTIENKIHLNLITSPTRSPLTSPEALPMSSSGSSRPNGHPSYNFSRGTFKSNSINYGSPVRRQLSPTKNNVHHIHHFHHIHPHSASPSLHSDSSLTPLEDSELSDSAVNANRSRNSTNVNNCDTVTVNSGATNSVWYEYGCV